MDTIYSMSDRAALSADGNDRPIYEFFCKYDSGGPFHMQKHMTAWVLNRYFDGWFPRGNVMPELEKCLFLANPKVCDWRVSSWKDAVKYRIVGFTAVATLPMTGLQLRLQEGKDKVIPFSTKEWEAAGSPAMPR